LQFETLCDLRFTN